MITTLKNKLFKIKLTPTPNLNRTFIVNFKTGETLNYVFNKIIFNGNNISYSNTDETNLAPVYENGVWVSYDEYSNISFDDGLDIENQELITTMLDIADLVSGYNVNFSRAEKSELSPFTDILAQNILYKTDRINQYESILQNNTIVNLELINTIKIKNNTNYILTVSNQYEDVIYTLETGQETEDFIIDKDTTIYLGLFSLLNLTINSDDKQTIIDNDFRYQINGGSTIKITTLPLSFTKVRFIKLYNYSLNYILHFVFNDNLETLLPNETRTLTLTNNTTINLETEYTQPKPQGNTIVGSYRFNNNLTIPTANLTPIRFTLKYQLPNQPYIFNYMELFKDNNLVRLTYVNNNVGSTIAFDGQVNSVLKPLKQEYRYLIFDTTVIDDYTLQWLNQNGTFGDFDIPIINDNDLILYQNTAENIRVDKTDYLKEVGNLGGVLRDSTSITNLTIDIVYDKFIDFNYIYFKPLNRYYYVIDVVILSNRLYRLNLSIDVLMSYKMGILNSYGFIDRNENTYNNNIIDYKRVIELGQDVYEETHLTPVLETKPCCILNGLYVETLKGE